MFFRSMPRRITHLCRRFAVPSLFAWASALVPTVAQGQGFVDLDRIKSAVTFSVGDVALYTPLGTREIINPAFGIAAPLPNDVFRLRINSGDGNVSVSDLFLSSAGGGIPNGTNLYRAGPGGLQFPPLAGLPGLGNLGLVNGDNIKDISFGKDGTFAPKVLKPTILLFSVDPDAVGARGAVVPEAAAFSAAEDVFGTGEFDPFGAADPTPLVPRLSNLGSNSLEIDNLALGLQEAAPKGLTRPATDLPDDLDALALGAPGGSLYFTLDQFSPTVVSGLVSSADILFPGLNTPGIFRNHAQLGLQNDDIVDALALSLAGNSALFSLDPDSPTILNSGGLLHPGDVFITNFNGGFGLFASFASLGLRPTDNLDALATLRVAPVPEPSPFLLCSLGCLGLLAWCRIRRGKNRLRQTQAVSKGNILVLAVAMMVGASGAKAQFLVNADALIGFAIQGETQVAVNPLNNAQRVIVFHQITFPFLVNQGYVVLGGGAPISGLIQLPNGFTVAGDPTVAYNSAGQAFQGTMGNSVLNGINDIHALFVAPQVRPGGAFLPGIPVVISADPFVTYDKELLDIDIFQPGLPPPQGSLDNIYMAFNRIFESPVRPFRKDVQFAYSTNRGRFYSRAVTISDPNDSRIQKIYATPRAARGNRVYVAWWEADSIVNGRGQSILMQASFDGGRSFRSPVPVVAVPMNPRPLFQNVNGAPNRRVATSISMAVDNSGGLHDGAIYLTWINRNPITGLNEIAFASSAPPAPPPAALTFTFGPPRRIDLSAQPLRNTDAFHPTIAVISNGDIAVIYYAKLNNITDEAKIMAVCSSDGGATWRQEFVINGGQIIHLNQIAPGTRIGDYIGLAGEGVGWRAVWEADNGLPFFPPNPANDDLFEQFFVCPLPMITGPVVFLPIPRQRPGDQVIPITSTSSTAAAAFQGRSGSASELLRLNMTAPSLAATFTLPDDPLTDVVITPDNMRAVEADGSGLNIVSLATNTLTRVPLAPPTEMARVVSTEITVTPDSRTALLGFGNLSQEEEGGVLIADLATATLTTVPFERPPDTGITVTPDSHKALFGLGATIQILDIPTANTTEVQTGQVSETGVVVTSDGRTALTAAGLNVFIIDIATATARTVPIPFLTQTDITLTPNGRYAVLVTAIDLQIIDVVNATRISVPLAGELSAGPDISLNGSFTVVRDSQGAHIITLATGADTFVPLPNANGPITNPVITPDGTRIVLTDFTNINIITLGATPTLRTVPMPVPQTAVISVAVTPDSTRAVFGTASRNISFPSKFLVVQLAIGAVNGTDLAGGAALTGASISPDGRRAVLLSKRGVEILNLDTLIPTFLSRTPSVPMLNLLPDDGQGYQPPFSERGRRSVLDGR